MAHMVKWLTRRIVAPLCAGSIPVMRPSAKKNALRNQGFYFYLYRHVYIKKKVPLKGTRKRNENFESMDKPYIY